ncbi:unnamed protein product [Withania somnifera]
MINGPRSEFICSDQKLPNGPRLENTSVQHNFGAVGFISHDCLQTNMESRTGLCAENDYNEDIDFSDVVLSYINQMLMEEDMENKTDMLQESLELQAKEKSFYEALGKKYPASPDQNVFTDRNTESPDDYFAGNSGYLVDSKAVNISMDYDSSYIEGPSFRDTPYYSVCSSKSGSNIIDGFLDSHVSSFRIPDICDESQSIWNFKKGVEEASKFLPSNNKLLKSVDILNDFPPPEPKRRAGYAAAQVEVKEEGETSPTEARGKKNPQRDDNHIEEERSSKQAAVFTESTLRSEEFDIVLLNSMGKGEEALEAYRQDLRNAKSKTTLQIPKGTKGGKGRGKKQGGKKEVIDLRTLLINCAKAVAADNYRTANELLKQIRQHSSPFGDGNQRLAHCFADGLEARLAGTGSHIYKALVNKRTSAADLLKAYHLYLASSPFRKISSFASNKTIMIKAENATRVHVIDFGILYGFQWPTFIQQFPQPGFRPAEQIEETGRRLADYARSFNVPFEYQAIAKKWESITIEDLKLDKDEFLAVNCLYRFKNLHDEIVKVDSSRTVVLNLIRMINPDIFVHGIVNGAYSVPFFVTRFREALFHFSALFDMLETIVPREIPERGLIEREIFGREALNVIACEGWERVERPETYKQWQARIIGTRFMQVPFDREEFLNRAVEKVRLGYHRDFVIDEDSQWLLLGWKGRTVYALSCWKPV